MDDAEARAGKRDALENPDRGEARRVSLVPHFPLITDFAHKIAVHRAGHPKLLLKQNLIERIRSEVNRNGRYL
jgi:hypothetical protein